MKLPSLSPLLLPAAMALLLPVHAGEPADAARTERMLKLMYRSNSVYSVLEAAGAGDKEVLAARLAEHADPNMVDEQGNSPLHLAAQGKSLKVVKMLLKAGADPTTQNARGRTPAELARSLKMRALFEKGLAARAKEIELDGFVKSGNVAAVRKALKAGVNPNARSADNKGTLLLTAVAARRDDVLRLLIEKGAKVDVVRTDSGQSALHVAAGSGSPNCIRLLLRGGADPMYRKGNGATPLHDAVWNGRPENVRALLPAYKQVNYSPNGGYNGFPVNMAIHRGRADLVKLFLDAGLNPNDSTLRGEPPLVLAAARGNADCVKLLLAAGADKAARDASGKTALDCTTQPELRELLR